MRKVNKKKRVTISLPEDAKLIKQYGSWYFYFSQSHYALFIEETYYHPHPLRLTANQFIELIERIDYAMASSKKEMGEATITDNITSAIEDTRHLEIHINKQKLN